MREMAAPDLSVGVVGAGAMGAGIAHVAATAGIAVHIFDTREGAAAKACGGIAARLAKRVDAGKMSADEAAKAGACLHVANALEELAPCDVVVEAAVEDLEVKRSIFSKLDGIVRPEAILASNTSSLPIGAIAAGLAHPERVAGLHFFNPVPVMRLVEVIQGPDTTKEVMRALSALGERLGRVPVAVKDTPGFLVNFGGRAYTTEGLAILHEGVATPAEIDAVMRDCCGFRMGPFELMDLTGMDVNFPVTQFVHESFFGDPRLRSTPLHRYMLDVGQLGRKTGRGFFDHREGTEKVSPDAVSRAAPAKRVVLLEPSSNLAALVEECGAAMLDDDDGVSPILAAPVGEDCSALAARTGCEHSRLVALDMTVDTAKRVTVMTPPGADRQIRDAVVALLATRRAVTAIKDSPGFIGQRISAMVANLGCEMAQIGLAAPEDIDTAMRLGLNYPAGPLELTDAWGAPRMFRILSEIQKLTGDDRYRPSQWLRRRAQLGLSARESA